MKQALSTILAVTSSILGLSSDAFAQASSCIHDGSEQDLLRLSVHATGIAGLLSDDDFEFASHHHDPAEEIDLQALEFNLFSNLSSNIQLQGTYNVSEDRGQLSSELEESFVRLHNLPYGFETKIGRFIHDLGLQGNAHVHDWNFATSDLTTSLLYGEEGVLTNGAELSWFYIYDIYDRFGVLGLKLAYGEVTEESEEEAGFVNDVTTLRATLHSYVHDYSQHFFGVSLAQGRNGFNRDTSILGFDYTYSWTESKDVLWNSRIDTSFQITQRNIEWEDAAQRGSEDQLAISASSLYYFAENWNLGARAEYIEGVDNGTNFETNERIRLTAALTRSLSLFTDNDAQLRLQYNYDQANSSQEDRDNHSLWLQMTFSFGKGWTRES